MLGRTFHSKRLMVFYKDNKRTIDIALVILSILILVSAEQFNNMGADSKLYFGLGENLIEGKGYIDNIRHDEILPSIGYPLITAAIQFLGDKEGFVFSKIWFALVLLLSYLIFKKLKFNILFNILSIFIVSLLIPDTNLWGIELTLALTITAVFHTLYKHYKAHNTLTATLFGTAVFISLLVRPVILPFIILGSLPILYHLIKNKSFRKTNIFSFLFFIIGISFVIIISKLTYKDNRLFNGTYSKIPLYCAFNPHIPLNKSYASTHWTSVDEQAKEDIQVLFKVPSGGWKERDKILSEKIFHFIKNNPSKAINGYLWRLSVYTFMSKKNIYLLMFFCWLTISIFILMRIRTMSKSDLWMVLILMFFPLYLVCLKSLFPYVGSRYLLTSGLSFLFSSLIMLSILRKYKKYKITNCIFEKED